MEKEVRRCKTFEDYLDSLVIEDDQKFLKDVDTARQLAQLGYRSSGKTLSEAEFYQIKEEIAFALSRSFCKSREEVRRRQFSYSEQISKLYLRRPHRV